MADTRHDGVGGVRAPEICGTGSWRVLQINLHRSRMAQELLFQTAIERGADVVAISEPLFIRPDWYPDAGNFAAIWFPNPNRMRPGRTLFACEGAVAMETREHVIVSCYYPPSLSFDEFRARVDRVAGLVASCNKTPIIIGDFNSKSQLWGSGTRDNRGEYLEEWANQVGVVPLLARGGPTFWTPRGSSFIDVAFVGGRMVRAWQGSRVLKEYSGSDHRYVLHEFGRVSPSPPPSLRLGPLDARKLVAGLGEWSLERSPDTAPEDWANEKLGELLGIIEGARRVLLPSRIRGKKPKTWWSPEVAEARAEVNRRRRVYTRARRAGRTECMIRGELEGLKKARRALKKVILAAKDRWWQELVDGVDRDMWGRPYRTALKSLKGAALVPKLTRGEVLPVIGELFATREAVGCRPLGMGAAPKGVPTATFDPEVEAADLIAFSKAMGARKAPGVDGLSTRDTQVVLSLAADKMAVFMTGCAALGVFPGEWKRARLALIPKLAESGEIKGYRPLSILTHLSKTFEYVMREWINRVLEGVPLHENQYGFRAGRSTTHAIRRVMESWDLAKKRRNHCALVALDVRNAFNTVEHSHLLDAFQRRGPPPWLIGLIDSYLRDRIIQYETVDGETIGVRVFAGVPQGSVIGPILWNIGYDDVLRVTVPRGVELVCYADDLAIIAQDRDQDRLSSKVSEVIDEVRRWMEAAGLQLAQEKTEAVLLTGRKRRLPYFIDVGQSKIRAKKVIKYLGVLIEGRRTFKEHLMRVTSRAKRVAGMLARLTPNIGACGVTARRCYYRVTESILLYASPAWGGASSFHASRVLLRAAQRFALTRLARAYRTVSADALCVLTGIPPILLKIEERTRIFAKRDPARPRDSTFSWNEVVAEERAETLRRWQCEWDATGSAAWTRELIPSIQDWVVWGPLWLNFHLTQCFADHGCFAAYLYRMGKIDSPACWFCGHQKDDARHTLLQCPAWSEERRAHEIKWGELKAEELVQALGASEERRRDFSRLVVGIMLRKEHRRRLMEKSET